MKKKIRGVRQLERQVENASGLEAEVVRDDCLAIRTVMRDDGQDPLEPAGLKLYQHLQVIAASLQRAVSARPSAWLGKLLDRLSVLTRYQRQVEQLGTAFGWMTQIAHLLKAEGDGDQAQSRLLAFIQELKQNGFEGLDGWVAHVEKITRSFAPHLFDSLKQPLLPRTNNELEVFIGRMKKSRRQATGRKNPQAFMLREGSCVAILFGLPPPINGGSPSPVSTLMPFVKRSRLCDEQANEASAGVFVATLRLIS